MSNFILETSLFPVEFYFCYTLEAVSKSIFKEENNWVFDWKDSNRRIDFFTARACIHYLFLDLKKKPNPIFKSKNGSPLWSDSSIGSLSHTQGCWGGVIGISSQIQNKFISIGLDIQTIHKQRSSNSKLSISKSMISRICREEEIEWLKLFENEEKKLRLKIIFSLKEACYKNLSSQNQIGFSFKDLSCVFDDSINDLKKKSSIKIFSYRLKCYFFGAFFVKESFIFSGVWSEK